MHKISHSKGTPFSYSFSPVKPRVGNELSIYNVRDFGALGDGVTMDTAALQQTVDTCHENGGGRVLLPPGRYLTASLQLHSNLDLHLEKGAVLLGSTCPNDYPEWQGKAFNSENSPYNARYLIGAEGGENISITGQGTIDGQGFAHYDSSEPERSWWPIIDKKTRPGRMLLFALCKNITIEGVICINSPAWTFWMLACEQVRFHNVTIKTDFRLLNTDGIDIDNCRDVTISHCNISTGDDAIILRAIDHVLKERHACEQIRVENCTLSSNCNAIRLAYIRDGEIRNVTMENLTIINSRRGIICQVPTLDETPERNSNIKRPPHPGPIVENIRFSNIRIEAVRPIWFRISNEALARHVSNVRFENIEMIGTTPSLIQGNKNAKMRNFVFENIRLKVTDGKQLLTSPEQTSDALALICTHCENITIRNLRVEGEHPGIPSDTPLLHFDAVEGISLCSIENVTRHPSPLVEPLTSNL